MYLRLAARCARAVPQTRSQLLRGHSSRTYCAIAGTLRKSNEASTTTATTGAMSPRVATLLDDLVSLNMLEVKELTDGLKDRLGIDDAAAMPMHFNPAAFAGAAAPGGGADAAAEEKPPEKTHFDLKLDKFDSGKKIAVIKEIRAITGLGLKEAKTLVEESPKVFKNEVAKEEAEQIRDKLKEIGAEVVLE